MPPKKEDYESIELGEEERSQLDLNLKSASFSIRLSKETENKIVEMITKKYERFLDVLWYYYYDRTEEFFNQLQHTIPSMIQKTQSKMVGLLLLGLGFLMSVGLSVYLFVAGLPDAGRLFIYPAILSLIMLILVLTKREGDIIAQQGS